MIKLERGDLVKIAVLQLAVSKDKQVNNLNAKNKIIQASLSGVDLVVLPEMFNTTYNPYKFEEFSEPEGGPTYKMLRELAKERNIYIVGGSIPESFEGKLYNTSYVFNRSGECIAKYRKNHLFDIDIQGGQKFKESATLSAGNEIAVFETEFGKIGVMICFDVRFAEFAKRYTLEDCVMVVVPANFNMTTGPLHWELLFRTRAIDNQMFYVGCASSRNPMASYVNYGNSIITDPMGKIVKRMNEHSGVMIQDINLDLVKKVRNQIPVVNNSKFKKSA